MQNSILGIPYDYSIATASAGAQGTTAAAVTNDEPGLIWVPSVGNGAVAQLDMDLGSVRRVRFLCILGLPEGAYNIEVFIRAADLNSPYTFYRNVRSNFSTFRSGPMKTFAFFGDGIDARLVSIRVPNAAVAKFTPWRVLVGDAYQPGEGISVGAEEGVDDRSVRRYARNGRRVIDPTVIVPTLQGSWPWLEDDEFKFFRRFLRQRGATRPSLIAIDPEQDSGSPHGGEDGIFYGDMEKSAKLGYEDGTYSFSFAMVSLAP